MSQLAALSLSIGVLGGLATWVFLTVGGILIWAAFVAWGCFFHSGGDTNALRNTIVCNIFGSLCAWVAAVIILSIPLADKLTLPLWAGIVVGAAVWVACYAANIKALSVIPASVYGFACTFAFLLQTPDKLSLASLMSPTLNNAFIVVSVSMVIGAVLGMVSGKVAAALTARAGAAA
jgi:hypothetical protein